MNIFIEQDRQQFGIANASIQIEISRHYRGTQYSQRVVQSQSSTVRRVLISFFTNVWTLAIGITVHGSPTRRPPHINQALKI